MFLTSSASDVAFASATPIDKIVRIFTGTYQSADLITRVGDIATAYVYRIPHGLPRPVACELITSTDGGTTWDLGINKIAFSDSTYVYIFHGYAASGPVMYKAYCSWIDDYDSTNPLIDRINYAEQPIQFDSRANYQKIYDQDEITVNGTTSITHPLGYAPNSKVFFAAFSGEVWPLNYGGVRNAYLYDSTQVEAKNEIYSDRIDITTSASARCWYRIYYDAD